MATLRQPLNPFTNRQMNIATSDESPLIKEPEQMNLSAVAQNAIDRKIARAEKQIENGQYHEANDQFIENLITRARKRNNLPEK